MARKSQYIQRLRTLGDSNQQSDYDKMKAEMLGAVLRNRGVHLAGMRRQVQYVERLRALDEALRKDREKYRAAQDDMKRLQYYIDMIKACPEQIFRNKFQEESGRIGFRDLSGEVRNTIYELAMFGTCVSLGEYKVQSDCNIWGRKKKEVSDDESY
jgi:hypothetical protein